MMYRVRDVVLDLLNENPRDKRSKGGTTFSKLDGQDYDDLVTEVNSAVGKFSSEDQGKLSIKFDTNQETVWIGVGEE